MATHSILQATIWTHHVHFLEEKVLPHGATSTIWNVGKQGSKVVAYCDTAAKKMEKAFYRQGALWKGPSLGFGSCTSQPLGCPASSARPLGVGGAIEDHLSLLHL